MEEKIEKLQDKVNRLTNIAWVLGTLAIIFGLGGGFGIKTILNANGKIIELDAKVVKLDEDISNSDKLLAIYREEQEVQFDKYVDSVKNEIVFVGTLNNRISRINSRISGISLMTKSAPTKSFDCGKSGSYTAEDLTVMYGSTDGTGCGVTNANYFKTISLNIPN